ncbi:nmda type glutamate receptor [Echinococcus multilocularis]|uniref:Nmda type glutamate receptor n=1 Tax=Echinococcus multilocularis TaxID=6211 RepID=A0A068Y9P5_ECHMU|nr:nmda type glutamate receptor [Echinococcus multilocularis]
MSLLRLVFALAIILPSIALGDKTGGINFTIGALLSSIKVMKHFNSSISDVRAHVNGRKVSFTPLTKLLASNALKASKQLCSMFAAGKGRLFAVVVSSPPNFPTAPPLSISYVAALYGVPVIGVSTRQAVFSDKYAHASFLRTVPPFSLEARVWADLIAAFEWHEVVLIHSDNCQDAKALLAHLELARQRVDFKITQTIGVNTDETDVVNHHELFSRLEGIKFGQTRAILLFVTRRYSERIFTVAERLGILGKEWAWLVSEQCLGASNIPLGVLGVRLAQSDELLHVNDAARVATEGIIRLARREPNAMFELQSMKNCNQEIEMVDRMSQNSNYSWLDYSVKLYSSMIGVVLEDGETGHVEFDSRGDRVGSLYDIVNVQPRSDCQEHSSSCRSTINTVGKYGLVQNSKGSKVSRLSLDTAHIYWPGNYKQKKVTDICVKRHARTNECLERATRLLPPPSFKKKTHLKVVTIQSTPFVDHVLKPPGGRCNTSDHVEELKFQVECTHTNATTGASACSVHKSMSPMLSAIWSSRLACYKWAFGH